MTSYTTNLDIALLDSNMDAPEDVVNAGLQDLDTKITGTVTCAFGTNTVTLTQDQQKVGSIFHLTVGSPGPTGDVTLNLAAGIPAGVFAAINDTGFPATIQYSGQSLTPPTLDAGAVGIFCADGSNVRAILLGGAGGAILAAIQASEDLTAGQIVNVTNSGGARIRKANATDNTKPAHGFVLASVTTGNIGIFYGSGRLNTGQSGLTPGTVYYLDTVGGGINATAPSSAGNLVQELGVALSSTSLAFTPRSGVTL